MNRSLVSRIEKQNSFVIAVDPRQRSCLIRNWLPGCKKSNWTRTITAYASLKGKKKEYRPLYQSISISKPKRALIKIPTKEIRNWIAKACVRKESCFRAEKKTARELSFGPSGTCNFVREQPSNQTAGGMEQLNSKM